MLSTRRSQYDWHIIPIHSQSCRIPGFSIVKPWDAETSMMMCFKISSFGLKCFLCILSHLSFQSCQVTFAITRLITEPCGVVLSVDIMKSRSACKLRAEMSMPHLWNAALTTLKSHDKNKCWWISSALSCTTHKEIPYIIYSFSLLNACSAFVFVGGLALLLVDIEPIVDIIGYRLPIGGTGRSHRIWSLTPTPEKNKAEGRSRAFECVLVSYDWSW